MNEHKAFPLFTALGGINEKYISDALDEKDREEFSRLKVIKKKKQKDAALKKAKELSAESA